MATYFNPYSHELRRLAAHRAQARAHLNALHADAAGWETGRLREEILELNRAIHRIELAQEATREAIHQPHIAQVFCDGFLYVERGN